MNLLLPLPEVRPDAVSKAVELLAASGGLEERGAVFTRAGVVSAILDLCGYTPDNALIHRRLLEPSFGDGDFLLEVVRRLVESFRRSGEPWENAACVMMNAIRAVELHRDTYEATVARVNEELIELGLSETNAKQLTDCWLVNDDFLLCELGGQFDFVVGNPPYVRQERIPAPLLKEYKWRYETLYDRADLYVLFYERGLDLLNREGVLGFICANRWIKNKYGGPLREKVGSGPFTLKYFIDVERAETFNSDVIAYPAITIIARTRGDTTRVALGVEGSADRLSPVVERLRDNVLETGAAPGENGSLAEVDNVTNGRDPWLLDTPDVLAIIRRLELSHPTLEASGATVGIGVATGADRVFIGDYDELPVEESRKLRLVMAGDCANDAISWGGKGIVNPYLEGGGLAPLEAFPCFAEYLKEHEAALRRRHTARNQSERWYKTIDRVYPSLTQRPKLLIPDIKGEATVAYDDGRYYPHHNLYVVTSDVWDLKALQAILRSSVALLFVAAYCVRMSGGFLRFQAQYLRRIRAPNWASISPAVRRSLSQAGMDPDQERVDSIVFPLYGLHGTSADAVADYARKARVAGGNK